MARDPHQRRPQRRTASATGEPVLEIASRNVDRRTQALVIGTGMLVLAACALWLFPALSAWLARNDDVCATLFQLRLVMLPLAILPVLAGAAFAVDATRILKHGRSPWPGKWLWQDTPVCRGRRARWRAQALYAAAVLTLIATIALLYLALFGELLSPQVHAQCDAATP